MIIADNEIHLWLARDDQINDPALIAIYHACMSADEKAAQQRFHFAEHRHQYLLTRALIRHVLSLYQPDVSPAEWVFDKNQYGRPFVASPAHGPDLHFNLSHTKGLIALAVARNEYIGVDTEWTLRGGEYSDIAQHYFAREEAEHLALLKKEEQAARFFDFWTFKEAYVKAKGAGLSIDLNSFCYHFTDEDVAIAFKEQQDDASLWQFWQVRPGIAHTLAIALKTAVRQQQYTLVTRTVIPACRHDVVNQPVIRRAPR